MPDLSPDLCRNAISALAAAGELAGAVLAFRSRAWRQFPWLTGLLAASLLAQAFLHTIKGHLPWTYFYANWTWQLLSSVLQLLVLIDICRSFPGAEFVGIEVPVLLGSAASVAAAGAAWISHTGGTIFRGHSRQIIMMNTITQADRALCFAAMAYLVCFLLAVKALHLGWSRRGMWVCQGLFWMLSAAMIASSAFSMLPAPNRLPGQVLAGTLYLVALGFWCAAMNLSEEAHQMPPELEHLALRLCDLPAEKVG